MLEAIASGFAMFLQPMVILGVLIGIIIGNVVGILPGISGVTALIITIPLTYNLDPAIAMGTLVAIQAVSPTGSAITTILLGIPGDTISACTLLDGVPMNKKGQGGRAVGAALWASAMGGLFGAVVLAVLIPIAVPLVVLFGSGEVGLLAFLGLTFIAVLARGSIIKGLISGFMGVAISFIGMQEMTGVSRYTFGVMELLEGVPLIPLIMGLFALPTVFDLMITGSSLAKVDDSLLKQQTGWAQVFEGIKDVHRYWKTTLRSSAVGTFLGMIPGVGAQTSTWIAYASAKAASKHPELFGTGTIEGVIAPEASNNSKEGGGFLPMLAFGIPGGLTTVILLMALMIHGIQPGPGMLKEHLDLTWSLIITLIFANILGAIILFPFISALAKIAFLRGTILIPIILVLTTLGAYAYSYEYWQIVLAFFFGILGIVMLKGGYNRVALALGFILGPIVELNLGRALEALGPAFLLRPSVQVLVAINIFAIAYNPVKRLIRKRRTSHEN